MIKVSHGVKTALFVDVLYKLEPLKAKNNPAEPIMRQDDGVLLCVDVKVYAFCYVLAALELI